jgi:hypothetical protein
MVGLDTSANSRQVQCLLFLLHCSSPDSSDPKLTSSDTSSAPSTLPGSAVRVFSPPSISACRRMNASTFASSSSCVSSSSMAATLRVCGRRDSPQHPQQRLTAACCTLSPQRSSLPRLPSLSRRCKACSRLPVGAEHPLAMARGLCAADGAGHHVHCRCLPPVNHSASGAVLGYRTQTG